MACCEFLCGLGSIVERRMRECLNGNEVEVIIESVPHSIR